MSNSTVYRIHQEATFQYTTGLHGKLARMTVKDIALVVDGQAVDTMIYVANETSGDKLFCHPLADFVEQLRCLNALQIG